jgi:hypothetical protein
MLIGFPEPQLKRDGFAFGILVILKLDVIHLYLEQLIHTQQAGECQSVRKDQQPVESGPSPICESKTSHDRILWASWYCN